MQAVLEECSGRGPRVEEFVQSLLQQEGGALLQAMDHIADLVGCLEGVVATLEDEALLEDKKGDDIAVGE